MQEITEYLSARLSGKPIHDGLWLLLTNMSLALAFIVLMLSMMMVGGIAVVLKPWMIILGLAAASVFVWYQFGKCLPPGQQLWRLGSMAFVGMLPVTAPTLYLYGKELTAGCHGAEILMMGIGTVASAVGLVTLYIGTRVSTVRR